MGRGRVIERTVEREEDVAMLKNVFLFYSMLDKYRKLVAVAEDMASEWNDCGLSVEGIQVIVELNVGTVSMGVMRQYAVYHPDENQYEPGYAMDYDNTYFDWVDGDWVKREPEIVEYKRPHLDYNPFEYIDELPF